MGIVDELILDDKLNEAKKKNKQNKLKCINRIKEEHGKNKYVKEIYQVCMNEDNQEKKQQQKIKENFKQLTQYLERNLKDDSLSKKMKHVVKQSIKHIKRETND